MADNPNRGDCQKRTSNLRKLKNIAFFLKRKAVKDSARRPTEPSTLNRRTSISHMSCSLNSSKEGYIGDYNKGS